MPRKRIALSVPDDYHALLTDLAAYQNKTVTTVVTDFLEAGRPMAEAMLKAFQDLHAGKNQAEVLQNLLAEGLQAAANEMKRQD